MYVEIRVSEGDKFLYKNYTFVIGEVTRPGTPARRLPADPRDGTLEGYTFSKRYKKVSPHRKSHNLLYNLLKEKNKPPQEMVNKRGVPFGPTWLTRTLALHSPDLETSNMATETGF